MPETMPMLQKDPRADFKTSRWLRLLFFSLLVSSLLVTLLIVIVRFAWDGYLAELFNGAPYNPRVEFIAPSILIIAFILSKFLWDAAEGRVPKPRRK